MNFLVKLLDFIHQVAACFLILGCLLPPKYLIYHVFLWPLVYLHWYFNDGRCILSDWQNAAGDEKLNGHESGWVYIRSILSRFIKNSDSITDIQIQYLIFFMYTLPWSISLYRLKYI